MAFNLFLNNEEKIQMQQQEIEKLVIQVRALESQVAGLQAELDIERNKPNEAYAQTKKMMAVLEQTQMEYEKIIVDLKDCREKYNSQIAQVQELKKKYSKEFKKTRKEHKKLKI